jgi:hypothetical protein
VRDATVRIRASKTRGRTDAAATVLAEPRVMTRMDVNGSQDTSESLRFSHFRVAPNVTKLGPLHQKLEHIADPHLQKRPHVEQRSQRSSPIMQQHELVVDEHFDSTLTGRRIGPLLDGPSQSLRTLDQKA